MAGVEGRVALVTGAGSASGIGFAIAKLFQAAGAKVAITSTTDRIFERLEELGGGAGETFAKPAELTDSAMVSSLIEEVEGFTRTNRHPRQQRGLLANRERRTLAAVPSNVR